MTRILCLWLPNWPIQRVVRCRPELKGRSAALVVNGPRGSEVAACCGTAASHGVRPGMPLVEAQSLVRDLGVAAYDRAADRRALVKWAEACERFSPRVALEEGEEPESLLLDISNLEHLWGSEAELIGQVKKFFTSRGYLVRLAVAETVGAAWAAAHFAEGGRGKVEEGGVPCSREAERSVSMLSPHMLTPLCGENMAPTQVEQLPVQALRIADDTAAVLRELGIETIGELMALPREGLAARFGDELLRRLDQLTGAGREVIEPQRGLAALEASYALEEPTGDRAVLMHVLSQLVDQLGRQLAKGDQGAVLLACSLRCTSGPPVSLRVGLLQPSACPRQLLELIELHLEAVKLADEVDRVELRAAVVGRLGERQGELFADRWSTDPHQLAVLVNRLSSRLGYERVLRAKLRASPMPERAVRWRGAGGWGLGAGESTSTNRKKSKRRVLRSVSMSERHMPTSPSDEGMPPHAIPLLLYPQPQGMEVVCVAPDGPPQFVWLEQRREPIVYCVGPERIETLWWRGPSVRRDYYRVATESGSHLWMFRRLADGRWFVHGVFA